MSRIAAALAMATLRCHCSAAHFPRKSFKQAVKGKKKPHYGLFLDSGSPLIAEHMAVHGYDWLLVDAQHAPTDLSLLQALLTAIDSRGCPSLVRVGGPNDRIGKWSNAHQARKDEISERVDHQVQRTARTEASCCRLTRFTIQI